MTRETLLKQLKEAYKLREVTRQSLLGLLPESFVIITEDQIKEIIFELEKELIVQKDG